MCWTHNKPSSFFFFFFFLSNCRNFCERTLLWILKQVVEFAVSEMYKNLVTFDETDKGFSLLISLV